MIPLVRLRVWHCSVCFRIVSAVHGCAAGLQGVAELMFHFLNVAQVLSKPTLSDSNSTEHSPYLTIYGHFSPDSLQLP